MRATLSSHFILHRLITPIWFGERKKLWSSLWSLLQSSLHLMFFLELFSNSLTAWSFRNHRDKVPHTTIKKMVEFTFWNIWILSFSRKLNLGLGSTLEIMLTNRTLMNIICKGKAVPLQAWNGPEGSTKLRFPDFMTTAQDGGKVVNLTHRPPLLPGNAPGTHFC